MSAARDTVTARVPGSTSNCGAGFDTLGLALSLYNRVTLTRASGGDPQPERVGDGRAHELVAAAATAFTRAASRPAGGFRYRIEGDVPPARGLGSSATIIAGVLAGLDALHGTQLSRHQLAGIGTALEGNPENICAGILGGFTVSRCDPATGGYLDTVRIAVPAELAFVIASPAVEIPTKESRGILPKSVPFFDAVKSINSAVYLTAAFATGDFEKLRHAVGDFMHEPYRLPRIRGAREAIAAGVAAGGLCGWLSGSGSSVLCVARHATAGAVATVMHTAFSQAGVASEMRVLSADNAGLRLE